MSTAREGKRFSLNAKENGQRPGKNLPPLVVSNPRSLPHRRHAWQRKRPFSSTVRYNTAGLQSPLTAIGGFDDAPPSDVPAAPPSRPY